MGLFNFQKNEMKPLDLNCDLAEGNAYDTEIMPLISSCNIACGGHVGNQATVEAAVLQAKLHHVKIGAHPSYPDVTNFGREIMSISKQTLSDSLHQQIYRVAKACENHEVPLHHIKFHGALYNQLAVNPAIAKLCFEVLESLQQKLVVFTLPNSEILNFKSKKLTYWIEGFADRTYNNQFSLTPRREANALLKSPTEILQQTLRLAKGELISTSGKKRECKVNTVCLHSDSRDTLNILNFLNQKLLNYGYRIA